MKRDRGMRLLHIASNHIDIMCDNCKTAFDLSLNPPKVQQVGIICPQCGNGKRIE
jgi:Zn finger protein HypA/HybF involved in hydrogenase expression